jgi:hypothetical protein
MLASPIVRHLGFTALLILIAVLWAFYSLTIAHAQQPPVHVFTGAAFTDSQPPPDGTIITAQIDGRIVARARSRGGRYILRVTQPQGQSYERKIVTFRVGEVQTGERQVWKPGRNSNVRINAYVNQGRSGGENRLPGRFIRACVLNALGRMPKDRSDMTQQELNKALKLCPSLEGRLGALRNQQPQTAPILDTRPQQPRTLDVEVIKQRQELQEEQQRLTAGRALQEQERIKTAQALQKQQDQLDSNRLKSESERQKEQVSLDAQRLEQEQNRIKAENEFKAEQQRLDQRRERGNQARQEELDKAQFESDKAKIDRERTLAEQRARLDQDRLKREQKLISQEAELNLNRQRLEQQRNQEQGSDKTPGGDTVQKGPSRGFFTNSQIGQLGSVNRAIDPSTLAVIGILITLAATMMQMVKGK